MTICCHMIQYKHLISLKCYVEMNFSLQKALCKLSKTGILWFSNISPHTKKYKNRFYFENKNKCYLTSRHSIQLCPPNSNRCKALKQSVCIQQRGPLQFCITHSSKTSMIIFPWLVCLTNWSPHPHLSQTTLGTVNTGQDKETAENVETLGRCHLSSRAAPVSQQMWKSVGLRPS